VRFHKSCHLLLALVVGLSMAAWALSSDAREENPYVARNSVKMPSSFRSVQKNGSVTEDGADLQLKEFRLDELQAALRIMQLEPEHDLLRWHVGEPNESHFAVHPVAEQCSPCPADLSVGPRGNRAAGFGG
jgi:hypothetical protein